MNIRIKILLSVSTMLFTTAVIASENFCRFSEEDAHALLEKSKLSPDLEKYGILSGVSPGILLHYRTVNTRYRKMVDGIFSSRQYRSYSSEYIWVMDDNGLYTPFHSDVFVKHILQKTSQAMRQHSGLTAKKSALDAIHQDVLKLNLTAGLYDTDKNNAMILAEIWTELQIWANTKECASEYYVSEGFYSTHKSHRALLNVFRKDHWDTVSRHRSLSRLYWDMHLIVFQHMRQYKVADEVLQMTREVITEHNFSRKSLQLAQYYSFMVNQLVSIVLRHSPEVKAVQKAAEQIISAELSQAEISDKLSAFRIPEISDSTVTAQLKFIKKILMQYTVSG